MKYLLAVACVLLTACASRDAPPVPPPPPLDPPADGALHVLLSWAAPVDLDLYVTDPAGESLYFGNNPTRAGARLERDTRCVDTGAGGVRAVEHAVLPMPTPGRYRVGVDYLEDCGNGLDVVPFRVVVVRGAERQEREGQAHRGAFNVVVLEFEVGEDGRIAVTYQR